MSAMNLKSSSIETHSAEVGVPPMEHRWGQRSTCRIDVVVKLPDGTLGAGHLRDVSLSGAFVETALDLALLARVELRPQHEGAASAARDAIVVRRSDEGAGVEWCETAAERICGLLGCRESCHATGVPPCQAAS